MSRNVIEAPVALSISKELQEAQKGLTEIDRREEAAYDIVVLWRKRGNGLFLTLDLKDNEGEIITRLPEIDLPAPDDKVPNRVEHAKNHPMIYFAAAGVATEAFFAGDNIPEAA